MGIRLIRPPDAVEPVSLSEAKAALRVDQTDEDALITSYIVAAREWVELRIQSKLAQETWELVIDKFPTDEIRLPFVPVQSITSIKYDDLLGDEQTIDPLTYSLDNTSSEAWVFSDIDWPATLDAFNSVRIRFIAGYSTANASLMPKPVIAALYLKLKELYDGEDNTNAIHSLLTNYYLMVA